MTGGSGFHVLIRRLASTRLASWVLSRVLPGIDGTLMRLSGGRVSLTSMLAGVRIVMVTTTGAKTGQARTSPLLPIWDERREGTFALIATNWGQGRTPDWYFNLKKTPLATCLVDGRLQTYEAREPSGEEYDLLWQKATQVYTGYGLYRGRAGRPIPILVLTPLSEAGSRAG